MREGLTDVFRRSQTCQPLHEFGITHMAVRAIEFGEQLLKAYRVADIEGTLQACANDPRLHSRAHITELLMSELMEHKNSLDCAVAGQVKVPITAAPEVPSPAEWWRKEHTEGPLFLGVDAAPCSQGLELASLIWQSFLPSNTQEVEQEPPEELLSNYAAAFRIWALAKHRLLAIGALIHGNWGASLVTHCWHEAYWLAERAWRSELNRQQVGHLALAQQACLQRARDFLHPLGQGDADFLNGEDLDEHAELVRSDLQVALGEQASTELMELRAALNVGGLRALVVDGLHASEETLRTVLGTTIPPSFKAQVAETGEVAAAVAAGRSMGPRRADEFDRSTMECMGVLHALEKLKSFCACVNNIDVSSCNHGGG